MRHIAVQPSRELPLVVGVLPFFHPIDAPVRAIRLDAIGYAVKRAQ